MASITLNKLVFELWEMRRSQIKETDPIDKRLIIDWVQTARSRLCKQKFDQPMAIVDDHYIQSLGPVELEKIVSNDVSIENEIEMYRTNIVIPRTIETKSGSGLFTRIGPADKLSTKYKVTTYEKALAFGNGKFNRNTIYAFQLGDYVYIVSKSGFHFGIKYLDIRGVFQDPITAARIFNPAWTYDDDYPINADMVDQLKTLIIQTKFNLTLMQPSDKTDDKTEDLEGQMPKVQQPTSNAAEQ
jgi:hypothetical protein